MARRRFVGSIYFDPQDIMAEVDQVICEADSIARECERRVRDLQRSFPRLWDFPPFDISFHVNNLANALERELQDDFVPRGRNSCRSFQRNARNCRQHSCQRETQRRHSSGLEGATQNTSRNRTSDDSSTPEICAVCQEDIKKSNHQEWILPCAHKFHVRCLRPWLNRNRTCPVCRYRVSLEDY